MPLFGHCLGLVEAHRADREPSFISQGNCLFDDLVGAEQQRMRHGETLIPAMPVDLDDAERSLRNATTPQREAAG
jgi:hypothetical protein